MHPAVIDAVGVVLSVSMGAEAGGRWPYLSAVHPGVEVPPADVQPTLQSRSGDIGFVLFVLPLSEQSAPIIVAHDALVLEVGSDVLGRGSGEVERGRHR